MIRNLFILVLAFSSYSAYSQSNSVGKIYNPYVQQLEKELEYELIIQQDSSDEFDDQFGHKLSYGQSINDRWFAEVGITAEDLPGEDVEISSYEIELKYQITEQGEFNNDWGVLFEIEREKHEDVWEFGSTLIVLHEWKKWVGTANASLIYETGSSIDDEFEVEFASQLRYRYKSAFEPGVEFFKSESTSSFGPSFSGQIRLGGGKNIFWSSAALFSFDSSKPEDIYRFNIEYEF